MVCTVCRKVNPSALLVVSVVLTCSTPWTVSANPSYTMKNFESTPISIQENATTPKVVINASNDHQLFFKAYADYGDINGDGVADTTYVNSIDYYGYFDSYKCYDYDAGGKLFVPKAITPDKYCTGANAGYWSGNFLNWISMARIDAIRKILFGGHRRVDTATKTILERSYLPHDAHSWAKHYDGTDLQDLTPFTKGSDYTCDQSNVVACGGDLKKSGITFANTTDVNMVTFKNKYSQEYAEPPLIKVVKGNYSLWASNERWQCTWASGAPFDNQPATNSNNPVFSKINAYANSPAYSEGIGEKDYVARVQVCVADDAAMNSLIGAGNSLIHKERCKKYPGPDKTEGTADDVYKPIGLLQVYGDNQDMEFAMVAGSYQNHASGGDLIKNMGYLTDEVNVDSDGTFPKVAQFAGGPLTNNDPKIGGLINSWSLYRIVGYDGSDGTYNKGDSCPWGLSKFGDVTKAGACTNWGNPFAEIYYQSINYLSGNGVIGAYRTSTQYIPGMPGPQVFKDPITTTEYCAPLFVINMNSSVLSYDWDELDATTYKPTTVWSSVDLPTPATSANMTNSVGAWEGIHGHDFFVGEANVNAGDDQLCTEKTVSLLGNVAGFCPDAPRLQGSYRIAGLAYYAHVKDIRPDSAVAGRGRLSPQVVDTYAVAMSSATPVIDIPDPDTGASVVTILPACRNTSLTPNGNCAIVDFKIVSQEIDRIAKTVKGKVYVNWEDSEQGGDYDQDMWGMLEYSLDMGTKKITIGTQVIGQSTPYAMGFGYVVSGTNRDGFHAFSGINKYKNAEVPDSGPGCADLDGCNSVDPVASKTYLLGSSTAKLLKDPLWYAAKYGGFTDSNGNNLPDLQSEWDSKINLDGTAGSDGIPDNYFYASDPKQLEDSLKRVFDSILERTSSGTAAAVVSSNVRGEGALYQAYYEPIRKDTDGEASWLGTIQSLWLDNYGRTRQDCSPPRGYDVATDKCVPPVGPCVPNGRLDNYCVDQVVETYYDELEKRTRVRVFESNEPDKFSAYSMQGVVKSFAAGNVTMVPNSLDGLVTYDSATSHVILKPYSLKGTVTAYDDVTGVATVTILAPDISGPTGEVFTLWQVGVDSNPAAVGYSTSPVAMSAGAATFIVEPVGTWIAVGDTVTLTTRNMVGRSGEKFNNWHVKCLQGSSAVGEIHSPGTLAMTNEGDSEFTLENITGGDFSTCVRARMSSYGMRGTAANSYSDWRVTNLTTILGTGKSSSTLTLAESGDKSFKVIPTSAWLKPGDIVEVSNYSSSARELYDVGYLWNGRKELYLPGVTNANLAVNRTFGTNQSDGAKASTGRHILTWVDADLDGVVDAGEFRAFEAGMIDTGVKHGFFNVKTPQEAKDVINYIRGIDLAGTRNRTLQYSPADAGKNTMRLGDIVNSTPTVVAAPQEAFNFLYRDDSYAEFRTKYQNRRIMAYAGANDGLLHAFNAGFFITVGLDKNGNEVPANDPTAIKKTVKYSLQGTNCATGDAALQHPLGSELWAYAPLNLLPHLQWLKDPNYRDSHVYFMDGKPRVFDANIFKDDADHPKGWGTVLVVGMNLGGGTMEVDTDSNDGTTGVVTDNVEMRSAYVIFDITNPEIAPKLLAELRMPDKSFTTVYPAVAAFRDPSDNSCNGENGDCNKWYLIFGTGPNDLVNYTSSQNAKIYLFDLSQVTTASGATPALAAAVPAGCQVAAMTAGHNVISCDTGVAKQFLGPPSVVDWEMDFNANTTYFGLSGDTTATQGRLMRLGFNNEKELNKWSPLSTLYLTNQPVTVQPTMGVDNKKNKWVFFGTGRYFANADKSSTTMQSLYGIKDDESNTTILPAELLNVSEVEVYSDNTLNTNLAGVTGTVLSSFSDIEKDIDNNATGWLLNLPPITGTAGIAPATRNITRSALLGGALFSTVYQPSIDPCAGEGLSGLYGLYYKTGTAMPGPAILGSQVEEVGGQLRYRSLKYLDLGRGIATAPAIHSGSGTGEGGLSVFSQLSTGDIVGIKGETPQNVRTGRMSWKEE